MIAQQTLPHIPAQLFVVLADKSFFFRMGNKGNLIDQTHEAIWDCKKQVLQLKDVDYLPNMRYTTDCEELVKYFGNLLYGN